MAGKAANSARRGILQAGNVGGIWLSTTVHNGVAAAAAWRRPAAQATVVSKHGIKASGVKACVLWRM